MRWPLPSSLSTTTIRPSVSPEPSARLKVGATLASAALVSASQFAVWTPVGADYIEGTQGRHFYPVLAFCMWVFYCNRLAFLPRKARGPLAAILAGASLIATLTALTFRYYGS